MAAKCAEISMVGTLKADYQQVPLVQNYLIFYNIVIEHQLFKINEEKHKIIYNKFSRNLVYYRNCIGQTHFGLLN